MEVRRGVQAVVVEVEEEFIVEVLRLPWRC